MKALLAAAWRYRYWNRYKLKSREQIEKSNNLAIEKTFTIRSMFFLLTNKTNPLVNSIA